MPSDSVIDWRVHKAIVFESDDWGNCGTCPDRETLERVRRHPVVQADEERRSGFWRADSLEDTPQMTALFDVLERHHGGDSRSPVFTAFYPTCNPDYDAIRASGFTEYHDIPIDQGWSQGWASEGAIPMAHQGMRRGIWYPEFHARLHHSHPKAWLDILRGPHEENGIYRFLFDNHIFYYNRHLPEHDGMTIRDQLEWLSPAVAAFERTFGMSAACGVNSDAIPGTEEVYSLLGISVRCLRSVVLNSGKQVRPYGTNNPDGTMDGTNVMGTYNRFLDLVYLNRNAFFETSGTGPEGVDDSYQAIVNCWRRNEPAVTSTHRVHYCSLEPTLRQTGLAHLDELLGRFEEEHPDVVYLTSWEVAQLCRSGTSAARFGATWILRNYTDQPQAVAAGATTGVPAVDLRTGARIDPNEEAGTYLLPPGDYDVS
ncbi:MAG: hypothetical protein HON70_01085 [Lentisphaerae bacterium]|nr:hypothetical protein [Lentisphaerota bacterium]